MNTTYDIIIQHNSTKREYVLSGLVDSMISSVYRVFENVDLDVLPAGEYSYAMILNLREDVEYELADVLLNSIAKTSEGDFMLKDLNPECGILLIGEENRENINKYYKKNVDFYYYRKK